MGTLSFLLHQILFVVSSLAIICAIIENINRIFFLDFRVYYSHPASFFLAYSSPVTATLVEVTLSCIIFFFILYILRIPAIALFILHSSAKSAAYFLYQFPLLTPYAFAGRSAPEGTLTGVIRWLTARQVDVPTDFSIFAADKIYYAESKQG